MGISATTVTKLSPLDYLALSACPQTAPAAIGLAVAAAATPAGGLYSGAAQPLWQPAEPTAAPVEKSLLDEGW